MVTPVRKGTRSFAPSESQARKDLLERAMGGVVPPDDFLDNIGLFVDRRTLTRDLTFHHMYQRLLTVHGVIMEFGVRWGRDLSLMIKLRGIYEPFNWSRRIIGFDTFEGFPNVAKEDGNSVHIEEGNLATYDDYHLQLEEILADHEAMSPVSHIRRFELVKGDAAQTLEQWLEEHPETIVAMAYFDMDIYEPTKRCLELLAPRLTKGSILGFDEINAPPYPGETLAILDTFGLNNIRIERLPIGGYQSFAVVE